MVSISNQLKVCEDYIESCCKRVLNYTETIGIGLWLDTLCLLQPPSPHMLFYHVKTSQ